MKQSLKEALLKQKIKRSVRKVIRKSSPNIVNENLYTTFVEPFSDAIQAISLGAQDFLNSYITYLRLFITWDPEKGKQLLADHDKRRAEIAAKWKPLMDKTDKALSTGDADIVALAFAPQVWALSAVGEAADTYAGDVAGILNAAGLGEMSPFSSDMSDYKPDPDAGSGILDKLQTLFFGAPVVGGAAQGALQATSQKNRQNEAVFLKEQTDIKDLEKDLTKHFDATGVSDELKSVGDDAFNLMKSDIEKFEQIFDSKTELFQDLDRAETFEDFISAIDKTSQEETANQDMPSSSEIKRELDKTVEKMINSSEFVDAVKTTLKKEKVTPEEVKTQAQKTSFLNSKKKLEQEVGGFQSAISDLRKKMSEQIKEILPTDAGLQILKKGNVTDVVNFVERIKKKFNL